ncbi:MAG: SPOR domain-containing protein [Betaproteobacteria bacterium]
MAPRTTAVDPAVDELKRKARRRLVGAIVLALAAAVILPMLLEKEPRPLGEDVAVKIPPIDEGKFTNRLSNPGTDSKASTADSAKGARPSAAVVTPAAPAAQPSIAAAPAADSTSSAAAGRNTPPDAEQSLPSPAATIAKAAPKAENQAEPKPETRVERKPDAKTPPPTAERANGKDGAADAFVVQLAAFSDDKGANALASKLKRNGYAAFTEPIHTRRGTLFRVRVGGYASREAAGSAREKLKGEGYSGIVAPAR